MAHEALDKLVKPCIFRAAGLGSALFLLSALASGANSAEWGQQKEAGRKAFEQGRYSAAEELALDALRLVEIAYPSDSPEVAGCLNDLGVAESALGRFNEAENLYRRALLIWEKIPGREASAARILSNLSQLLVSEGRYSEAEAMGRRALEIHEEVVGTGHPDTVPALINLGQLYEAQGRYHEAGTFLLRALAIREQAFGENNPDTALTLAALGQAYSREGKTEEAKELLQRSLQITQKTLSPRHPRVAAILNNLSSIYSGRGKYKEAEQLLRDAWTSGNNRWGRTILTWRLAIQTLRPLILHATGIRMPNVTGAGPWR